MRLSSFLPLLASADHTLPAPRRTWLQQLGRTGARALAAALPLSLPQAAAAAPTATSLDALLLLLRLERTQYALYSQGLAVAGLVPGNQLGSVQLLQQQQGQHLAFITQLLTRSGVVLPTEPSFDFSGRRNVATNPTLFPNVFTNYDSFLQLAQALEDAGTGFYKSQALLLAAERTVLVALLRMHAVEARHAAQVRTLRRQLGVAVKSWPSSTDVAPSNAPAALAAVVALEANTTQYLDTTNEIPFVGLLVDANRLNSGTALAEAFDEPVPAATAQAFLDLFA